MLLDIGLGIIASIFTSLVFDVPLTTLLIMAGILFALLPDLDFLWFLFRGKSSIGKDAHTTHRDLLHYPTIFTPLGAAICWLFFGAALAFLFALASFLHFLHDTAMIGWGIRWLWPFSKIYFGVPPRHRTPGKAKMPFQLLYRWKPEEIKGVVEQYGDPDWFKNIYLRASFISILELVGLLISLFILYTLFR